MKNFKQIMFFALVCLLLFSCSKESSSSSESNVAVKVDSVVETAKESTAPEQKADESSSTDVAEPADNSVFEQVELLDKFGDPTGEFYVRAKNDFEGTYSIEGGATNGNLKWNFELYEDEVRFILKEYGSTGNLSAARLTTDMFTIDVKYESGDIISYDGEITRGKEGNYNCISVLTYNEWYYSTDLSGDLKCGGVCKISIYNDHGTYNLGAVDVTEIERMFYDVDTYNEITKIYESGDYTEAWNMINSLKATDAVAYDHFALRDIEIESLYQVMCSMLLQDLEYEAVLEEIKIFRNLYWSDNVFVDNPKEYEIVELQYYAILLLYKAGKYEVVMDGIEDFWDNYKDYNLPEFEEIYQESARALGVYLIGDTGPAGGYVFYDVDADNDSGNEDGLISSECGWRFLEAAPADLRVVNEVPTVDSSVDGYSSAPAGYVFGHNKNSGPYLYVNGTTSYNTADCTNTTIGSGKSNTEKLVSSMGCSAYSEYYNNRTTDQYAARLCNDLEYNGYDDWFLPSIDELDEIYFNLGKKGITEYSGRHYWSSSEGYDAYDAWGQSFSNGYQGNYGISRYEDCSIRPCRAF